MAESCELAVVGGGAAGLMAALWAARESPRKVVLLEGSNNCGSKIVAAGGGRCNVLPSTAETSDFFSQGSNNVIKRLLKTWRLKDLHNFFEWELQLPLADAEDDGRVFPECQSGRQVRDQFISACHDAGVEIKTNWRVEKVEHTNPGFKLSSSDGQELICSKLIMATGGKSVPKTGSDGHGFNIAKSLGHKIHAPYPALVPLTSKSKDWSELAGVAVEVKWRAILNHKTQEERVRDLLITHRGFSGPAILDASHWAVRDQASLVVAWGGGSEEEWNSLLNAKERRELGKALSDVLPKRLANLLIEKTELRADMRCRNLSKGQRIRLLQNLCNFQLPVNGNEGFDVAEVTGGGIRLEEVNPSTMESRKTPGLFLCGEILDCVGRMGGYNFLWAWITGRLAGSYSSTEKNSN